MGLNSDFADTQQAIQASLVATTRAATNIASQDISFHRSLNPSVTASLDEKSQRLLRLTERLIQRSSASSAPNVTLRDVDAIDEKWKRLIDVADGLFERADSCLDEYSGLIQKPDDSSSPQKPSPAPKTERIGLGRALRRPDLPKPQLDFETTSFNHETTPFKPFLTQKPHAKTSLEDSVELAVNEHGEQQYRHPYEHEIKAYSYPEHVLHKNPPQNYRPFNGTSAIYVDSEEKLKQMIKDLKKAKEIAVDLEHHDHHSYVGLVSLMQISTRDQDWVVDTLKPWRRRLEALNHVFADPNILKVFHGAHMDIIWLQRDLGLYIVGMFDTHFAARVLGYTGKSLAYLLKRFVDFDAQKQYQTADWRIRPLPSEMLDYARSDTHFLLYIYDCMRNELLEGTALKTAQGQERDCVDDVLQLSNEQCLQRYEHSFYDDSVNARRNGWAPALARHSGHLTKEQIAVYAALHRWRDNLAREEDEGLGFVMPNHVLQNIVRALPTRKADLLAVSHPISPMIKKHSEALVELLKNARLNAAAMPDMTTLATVQYGGDVFNMGAALRRVKAESQQESTQALPPVPTDNPSLRAEHSRLLGETLQNIPLKGHQPEQQYKILLGVPGVTNVPSEANQVNGFTEETKSSTKQTDNKANGAAEPIPIQTPLVLGKRKPPPVNDDQIALSSSEDEAKPLPPKKKSKKARAKAERKAAKRAEEEAAAKANGVASSPVDLTQERDNQPTPPSTKSKKSKKEVKAIPNPYARAEQAAPGLKRPRMYTAGKSGTFKS